MKVGLVTTSKFHVFDTARQLHKRGLLGRVVSGYPKRLTDRENLPPDLIINYPWFTVPLMASNRLTVDTSLQRGLEWAAHQGVDRRAASVLNDCDLVLGMHCSSLATGRAIQARGGRYWVDRPVVHIVEQDEILAEAHEKAKVRYKPIDPRKLAKEIEEYDAADQILVPSQIVARSMTRKGIPSEKVAHLPLGADLRLFSPQGEKSKEFEILFAGNLSVQKGIYVLAEALEHLRDRSIRLSLAGPVLWEAKEALERIEKVCQLEVHGKVPQDALCRLMTRATLFILPSVQDGFGVVVPQALGCGTPCIVSDRAGASEILRHGESGWIFPSGDAYALAEAILELRTNSDMRHSMADQGQNAVAQVGGWDAYGGQLERLVLGMTPQIYEPAARASR